MKTNIQTLALATLLPAMALSFTSCSTDPKSGGKAESASLTAVQPGVAGGSAVETYKETATVKAIDKASRKVTLLTADGSKSVVKCGPEVANFAQIEVGDQVTAIVTEQLVVFVRRAGALSGDGAAAAVALAPIGDKPAGIVAATEEITAKVKALDVKKRKATVLYPDGKTKTFKVRPDVDMTKYQVGDEVVFRITEAFALSVDKPSATR